MKIAKKLAQSGFKYIFSAGLLAGGMVLEVLAFCVAGDMTIESTKK